jgi:membrane protein YqaA with SNARE-associated domain
MLDIIVKILGNYLIVQTSIILFIAPFYLLYWRKHVSAGRPRVSFNRHLEYFFTSNYANWLVFFWAMGEALIWFVIPEFLLVLLVFMRIRRRRELVYYDIGGTIAGTLVAFMINLPDRFIEKLPYVQPRMLAQARYWYNAHGILGLIYQPFSGVPYKVFTHLAHDYHFFIVTFLIVAVIVRISRYYIIYLLLSSIYPVFHKYVYRNYVRLFLIATFIFSVLLLRVFESYGSSIHTSGGLPLTTPSTVVHTRSFRT